MSLIILLTGCIEATSPPVIQELICSKDPDFIEINGKSVCSQSQICRDVVRGRIDRYFCVCDLLCLCFISNTQLNLDCVKSTDAGCRYTGLMTILNNDFCKSDDRLNFLNILKEKMKGANDVY